MSVLSPSLEVWVAVEVLRPPEREDSDVLLGRRETGLRITRHARHEVVGIEDVEPVRLDLRSELEERRPLLDLVPVPDFPWLVDRAADAGGVRSVQDRLSL